MQRLFTTLIRFDAVYFGHFKANQQRLEDYENLPAAEKMRPAGYEDFRSRELPAVKLARGGRVKVIAGSVAIGHDTISRPISSADRVTRPVVLDVTLRPDEHWTYMIDSNQTLLVRVYEGATTEISTHQMGVYVSGDAEIETAIRDYSEGRPVA